MVGAGNYARFLETPREMSTPLLQLQPLASCREQMHAQMHAQMALDVQSLIGAEIKAMKCTLIVCLFVVLHPSNI